MSSELLTPKDYEGKNAKELHNCGGKRYAAHDYTLAVQYFTRACELGVKEYGDPLHDKLGETYLLYGKSLLELTREDGDPLGENVPKDVPVGAEEAEEEEDADGEEDEEDEADDNESDEDESDEELDAGGDENVESENAENEKQEKNDTEGSVEGASGGVEFNGEKGDVKVDEGTEETKEGDDPERSDKDEETGDKQEEDKEEEAEPSDLQVAWEILELGKIIFRKRGEAGKPYLADALITLGEIAMESENIESAIADITEAVEVLKTLGEDSSRVLAEAYYKLGMAVAMDNKIEEAIVHYKKSKEILENHIITLGKSDRPIHKKFVEDMKKVLPEIDEKVADLKCFHEEQLKKAAEDPRPVLPGSPEKKASDISHLVKRKRRSEDEGSAGPSDPPTKKPALD